MTSKSKEPKFYLFLIFEISILEVVTHKDVFFTCSYSNNSILCNKGDTVRKYQRVAIVTARAVGECCNCIRVGICAHLPSCIHYFIQHMSMKCVNTAFFEGDICTD